MNPIKSVRAWFFSLPFIAVLLVACGATDIIEPSTEEELVDDETPVDPVEEAAFQAALEWQWARTPRRPFEDVLLPIDGFEGVDDSLLDSSNPVDPDADVEKGNTPLVWGWAVKGPPQMQDGDTVGPYETGFQDHCTQFGLACDNQPHAQASDTSYTGGTAADFADELRGRCGRYDSTVDNAWLPCILPYRKPTARSWTWTYDAASCGLDSAQYPVRDRWLAGIRQALTKFGMFSWTETTSANANLTFYCSFGEIPAGKIAIGYPYGPITLRYAADHIFDEWCESGVPGEVQLHANHFADMYYTYGKGRVGINWADFWEWIGGCGGNETAIRARIATIMQHEIGHVMGFAHAQLPATTNFMATGRTCAWARNAGGADGVNWRWFQTLSDYDISTNTPLQTYDEDISCYSPLGGGETPSD